MKNIIPKVAAIHDLTGIGRCSLAVVLPVLSCLKVQACSIPTAVLSTQTGGFHDYHFVDLTDEMPKIMAHLNKIHTDFDCIYSGFLGSVRQIDIVIEFIEKNKDKETLIVIDPVMGDNGKYYSVYDEQMGYRMKELVKKADLITPNLTEASLLLDRPMPKEFMTQMQMRAWTRELCSLGPDICVITSVTDEERQNCVVSYDKTRDEFLKIPCKYLPYEYPGTGDIFTSVLTGMYLNGHTLKNSLVKASDFVYHAVLETSLVKTPLREGVIFEKVLNLLL